MKNIWSWIKNNPNRSMFLVPILLVAGISISHVVTWYDMANPINWAIYLSVAIEIGAITALVAATNKIKGGIWFMFGIVTLIQMIGNIFFSYKEIDANGDLFKSWIELTGPIWELMGTETTDIVGMKRWLAFLEGGLLPIISLTSLHFFVKYEKPEEPDSVKNTHTDPNEGLTPEMKKTIIEEEEKRQNEEVKKKVFEKIDELRKEGKLYTPTEEDLENEPTALAFTPHEEFLEGVDSMDDEDVLIEEQVESTDEEEWDEDHALDMVLNQMVEDLMEEEGVDSIDELNEKLDETTSDDNMSKNDKTVNNKLTKKKMGIDRIK